MTTNQLDTKQFNDTPVIRKLSAESSAKSNRGRKRKYNTPEERLEARRLQQKQYRERKKQQAQQLKQTSDEVKEDA